MKARRGISGEQIEAIGSSSESGRESTSVGGRGEEAVYYPVPPR
jgi:hypothetical protein